MNTHKWPRATLALASALAALGGPMWAQQVPAPAGQTAPAVDDETIVLSPFEVSTSKDKGYKATNATSGTRLDTAIKDIPLNLEVITNDFMRDTGAKNLRESLRYSAGVVLDSQSDAFASDDGNPQSAGANDPRGVTRRQGDSTTKLRGFVIDQVLRDGFRRQYSADWINIERTEVLRGPSALLYGVGSIGGVINYMPKRPGQTEKTYFGASVGSPTLLRGEFDYTTPLGEGGRFSEWKPAMRVMGAYQEQENHTDYYEGNHWMIAPTFEFRPFKNTVVFLDNEFGRKSENGVGFQNIRAGFGDGESTSPGRNAAWITDSSGGIVDNRTFRWSGPDTYQKGPYRNNLIDITQKISDDFFVKVGAGRSKSVFDSRQIANASALSSTWTVNDPALYYQNASVTLPDIGSGSYSGSIQNALTAANLNGNFRGYTPAQIAALRTARSFRGDRLYSRITEGNLERQAANQAPSTYDNGLLKYEWQDYNREETRDQVRADATYTLDTGSFGRHTFILGAQYMGLQSKEDHFGPAYSYENRFGGSNYVANVDRYSYKRPNDYSPFRYGVQGDGLPDAPQVHLYNWDNRTWDLGYYGVYQGQFFDDRLTLIGGLRHDRSDARRTRNFIYESTRPAETQSRGAIGVSADEAPTATSPQIGINFALTREISLFAVYSTGIVPNPYAYDGNGNMMKPTEAKSYEAGVKFDLFEGKLSGTASAYRIERKGQPKNLWWAPSPYESALKGYDPSKPPSTVAWFAPPEAIWHGIHNTPGKSASASATIAKQIWPTNFHGLIDELAGNTTGPGSGAEVSRFWTWDLTGIAYPANVNTENPPPGYTGGDGVYFPLLDLSNPDVAAFMNAVLTRPGWNGNYYYTAGQTYFFGNGTAGKGNAANGSGAYVPMNDQSDGWDVSMIFTPNDDLQIIANFAHIERKITSRTYQFVKAPFWPFAVWYTSDNNYGTHDSTVTAASVYGNIQDSSTYNQTIPDYNNAADDTPENTASLWVRYSLQRLGAAFEGWTIGAGGQWEDKRMWYSGFAGGNVSFVAGSRTLLQLYTDDRYTFNAMVEYRTRIADKYNLRVALNADNVLDDQGRYGLVYAPGASYRLSAGVDF